MSQAIIDLDKRPITDEPKGTSKLIPDDILKLLGKPNLIHGESRDDYQNFFTAFVVELRPTDLVEWLLVKDIVEAQWNADRLRRAIRPVVYQAMREVVGEIVGALISAERAEDDDTSFFKDQTDAERLLYKSLTKNPRAAQRLGQLLASAGLDESSLPSAGLAAELDKHEQIDRMILNHTRRRDQLLNDLNRRRQMSALLRPNNETAIIEDIEVQEAAE